MSAPVQTQHPISSAALVTVLTLTGLILAGWAALVIALPSGIPHASALWAALCRPMPQSQDVWTGYQAALAVWLPMVPAMMLPSAIPMALSFANRIEGQGGSFQAVLLIFTYLSVWLVAAAGFAALQTGAGLILAMVRLPEPALAILGGFGLGVAGLWQFAPVKRLSLAACRHDFNDVPAHPTALVTIKAGAQQGLACIGCCWVLMLAAAAAGAMNLIWMAVLAAIMTAEKMIGPRATAPLGLVLLGLGAIIAIDAVGAGRLLAYWRG